MEKNCSIHISYIYTLNKKWSPAEFEDMSEISASMPTPTHTECQWAYKTNKQGKTPGRPKQGCHFEDKNSRTKKFEDIEDITYICIYIGFSFLGDIHLVYYFTCDILVMKKIINKWKKY